MDYQDLKVSEKTAQEVIELASKLYAQDSQQVSASELIKVGEEAQIPSEFIEKALKQIYSKTQKKAKTSKLPILLTLIILSFSIGAFTGYKVRQNTQNLMPSEKASLLNTLVVKEGKLEYFDDKLLFVAVENIISSSVDANIGVDGYKNLEIKDGGVGDNYEYKTKDSTYHIRIVEVRYEYNNEFVRFKIERLD